MNHQDPHGHAAESALATPAESTATVSAGGDGPQDAVHLAAQHEARECLPEDAPLTLGGALLTAVLRLLIGFVMWVVAAILLLISAAPFGGGSEVLSDLLMMVTVAVPIWAFLPVASVLRHPSKS